MKLTFADAPRRGLKLGAALVILLGLALWSAGAAQAVVERLTLKQVAERARSGVVGTVTGLESHWNAGRTLIFTTVTLRVDYTLKGAAVQGELAFEIPGGVVDGLALGVSDVATFHVGDRVAVFLADTDLATVGGFQGRFWLVGGRVYREAMPPMSLVDFLAEVSRAPGVRVPDGLWQEAETARAEPELAAPVIASISPTFGPAHADGLGSSGCASDSTLVTIDGANFGAAQGTGRVDFLQRGSYKVAGCVVSWSDTQILVRVPARASSGPVTVVTDGGTSNEANFTVTYSYAGGKWPAGGYPQPMSEVTLVNPNTADTTGELAAVQAALDTWSDVVPSDFQFRYGGTTTISDKGYDGSNVMLWVNYDTGSIATNYHWWYSSDPTTVIEFDIVFNDLSFAWATDGSGGAMDVQNIATHELGHSLVLLDLYGSADSAKTMYGFASNGQTSKRTLEAEDIAGITFIYGGSVPPTNTPTPTPTHTPTPTPTSTPTPTNTPTPTPSSVDISLYTGWNLISFPLVADTTSPRELFASIEGSYDSVYAWDSVNQEWLNFSPALPDEVQSLTSLDHMQGFWIHTLENLIWRVNGSPPAQTDIPLNVGWNLVGFPAGTAREVPDALATIDGQFSIVFEYDASVSPGLWRSYSTSAPPFGNTLAALRPTFGYWVKATEPCVLSVAY